VGDFAQSHEALLRLAARLRRLDEDGLDPRGYRLPDAILAAEDTSAWRAALQRSATLALSDLLFGRVPELPGRVDLRRAPATLSLATWMAELIAAPEPTEVLDRAALLPPDAAALKLALAAARLRAAAGGQPAVPPFDGIEALEPGAVDPLRVPALRVRLTAIDTALAEVEPAARDTYDEALVAAVRRFQAAEGLQADGRIGRATFAALNQPGQAAIRQLRVALDMRRAAAPAGAERRIEVNVPHQRLQVIEGRRVLLDMAVIVGKAARATPMLRVRLTAVQFNPSWGVPERNAREDLLPRFRANPRAMMDKGFRVYGVSEGQQVEISPASIDWRAVNPAHFPYVIRQDAGEANALGRIKFIIPNTEDIYLHDTPDRSLFRRAERALSSGCIRLEKPLELLDIALEGTAGWDRARALRALDSQRTSSIAVGRSLPVRLHYTTAVVEGGEVRLRPDIYGLDDAYLRALDAPRAASLAALTGDR